MEDINVKNKGILPERFYIGYAINIGNGVEELERDYLPVALSEYEDGVIFDEISNERVFVGETIDDITSDEFLGLDINCFKRYFSRITKRWIYEIFKKNFNV